MGQGERTFHLVKTMGKRDSTNMTKWVSEWVTWGWMKVKKIRRIGLGKLFFEFHYFLWARWWWDLKKTCLICSVRRQLFLHNVFLSRKNSDTSRRKLWALCYFVISLFFLLFLFLASNNIIIMEEKNIDIHFFYRAACCTHNFTWFTRTHLHFSWPACYLSCLQGISFLYVCKAKKGFIMVYHYDKKGARLWRVHTLTLFRLTDNYEDDDEQQSNFDKVHKKLPTKRMLTSIFSLLLL